MLQKLYVGRNLNEPVTRKPFPSSLSLVAAPDVPRARLLDGLARCDDTRTEPQARFDAFLAIAGDALDPRGWLALVDGAGEVVGVAFAQRFPDELAKGTMLHCGVAAEWRGRGIGTALHGAGLDALAGQGVERYVGSTAIDNAPMLRVFEHNACIRIGVRAFHDAQTPDRWIEGPDYRALGW